MKPTKKDIKKWCAALRSGEYKQGKGALEDAYGNFCCLGVACKVFIPESKQGISANHLIGGTPDSQNHSPKWLKVINRRFSYVMDECLMSLNDDKNFTFDEIADLLELVYIHEAL